MNTDLARDEWRAHTEAVQEQAEFEARLAAMGYPPSLIKACRDPFDYALQLRNGPIIHFFAAYEHGEWVTLVFEPAVDIHAPTPMGGYPFERGVNVRVADIVWCADAPNGS